MLPDWHRIVDLTQPVTAGMAVYPGDPPVEVEEVAHQSPHGFAVARLALNDHAGTHMETQHHMIKGRTLADHETRLRSSIPDTRKRLPASIPMIPAVPSSPWPRWRGSASAG